MFLLLNKLHSEITKKNKLFFVISFICIIFALVIYTLK